MPRGTPALAHACAHALWAAPDAPLVVLQFKSTTGPVIVISWPAVAAWPCAASGSAHRASTVVVARMRFNIVHPPVYGRVTDSPSCTIRRNPVFRIGVYWPDATGLSRVAGNVWPRVGARRDRRHRVRVRPRRRVPRNPVQRAQRRPGGDSRLLARRAPQPGRGDLQGRRDLRRGPLVRD